MDLGWGFCLEVRRLGVGGRGKGAVISKPQQGWEDN